VSPLKQEFLSSLEAETCPSIETVLVGKSGNRVHLAFHATALRDENETRIGFRGTGYDITEFKQTEQRLRESEERYRSVAELTGEWIWELDRAGNHTASNGVLTTILGFPPEEFLGKSAFSFMHPDDQATVEAELPRLLAEKRGWRGWIVRWRHRDGTYRFLESNAKPMFDATGQMCGYRGSDRDVTERIQAERMAQILHEVVISLFSCSNLRDGAEKALHAILQFDFVDCGGFYFPNSADGSLDLIAHHGLSSEFTAAVAHIPVNSPKLSRYQRGEAWYGAYDDMHIPGIPPTNTEGLRAIVSIPIMCQGQLLGILNLASHLFDSIPPESRRALETIAIQIGETVLRLRADIALRETEEIFRHFMDRSPIYVFFKDENRRYLRMSSNYAELVGKPRKELIGKTVEDLFPPELAREMHAEEQRAFSEGKTIVIESELHGRWYSTIRFPIMLEGKPRYIAGYAIDITDRKLAENAVAAEKERLAITLRSIADGVITTDTHGRIEIMNNVAELLTGWKQEEARGKPLSDVFHIIDEINRQPCESPFNKVLATGDIVEIDGHTVLISQEGTERVVAYSGAPIRDWSNTITGVALAFRDMTEKQRFLDILRRMDKLDSLGILAGGLAHDFNNLLCGILGHLDLARMHSTKNPDAQKHLDEALGVFSRARDLTRQLLTFSKGGAPRRKTVPLSPVILQSAAFALSGSNVRCEYRLARDLWLCDFDENQIGQVVDNIVINAQQAMPQGGNIEISANNLILKDGEIPSLPGGKYVNVSIADTGIGIPGDLLVRIFDPFFTTKPKGNGLGLSMCHSIMQKHEGFIGVDSVPGKGTAFHLYFPASDQAIAERAPVSIATHQGTGRILIMDDEEFIRDVMATMLATMGYTPVESENGREALGLIEESREKGEPFCAAFFDLTIPGSMGGKEAIREVRKMVPDLPVFVASGYSDDPAMAWPQDFGFTDSIQKPYRLKDLADLLSRHLKSREIR